MKNKFATFDAENKVIDRQNYGKIFVRFDHSGFLVHNDGDSFSLLNHNVSGSSRARITRLILSDEIETFVLESGVMSVGRKGFDYTIIR